MQYPTGYSDAYGGKLAPITSQATALFDKISADEPFLVQGTGIASEIIPDVAATPAPEAPLPGATPDPATDPSGSPVVPPEPEVLDGVTGQTAADQTCTKPFGE